MDLDFFIVPLHLHIRCKLSKSSKCFMANVQVMRNKMNLNINAVNLEQCIKIS